MVPDDSRHHRADDDSAATEPAAAGRATGDVTRILSQIERGDGQAAEQLLPLVYEQLRQLAAAKMAQEKPGQTLQATALVHEAYIRLVDADKAQHWNSRGHFYSAAAEAMRRILVERARHKETLRAGGDAERIDLNGVEQIVYGAGEQNACGSTLRRHAGQQRPSGAPRRQKSAGFLFRSQRGIAA